MKHLLLTTIAAVLLVGCGPPQPPDISIHEAAGNGNIEAVKQHLVAGTDVHAEDEDKNTPLHIVAVVGRKEVAELLIAKGADVNGKIPLGYTPLHYAAGAGHKEIVELLLAKGADVNANNYDVGTPLDGAEPEPEIIDLLRKHGGKTYLELEAKGK